MACPRSFTRGHAYLRHQILQCTASGSRLDSTAARFRSPLFWDLPETPRSRIELYAGIKDGHSGTVPISHSIAYYNRLTQQYAGQVDAVTPAETIALLTGALPATSQRMTERAVFFQRESGFASLTIFDGGHEMLPTYSADRLLELSARP